MAADLNGGVIVVFEKRGLDSQTDRSAILPTYRELVSGYATYLETLGRTIESLERSDNLHSQIHSLRRHDFAEQIPESAQARELEQLLARAKMVDPVTHIFSLEDITPVRQLIAEELGNGDPDELFDKLCLFERIMSRNGNVFGDSRVLAAIPVTELQQYTDETIEPVTPGEFDRCLALIQAKIEEALSEAEEKLNNRDSAISLCSTSLLQEIGDQPALFVLSEQQNRLIRPALSAFNAWAVDSYNSRGLHSEPISSTSNVHAIGPYLRWRYQLLGELEAAIRPDDILSGSALTSSLEGKLGKRSEINHFDVFLLERRSNPQLHAHFHETLSMRLLLAISNPAADALVFQGSEGVLSRQRLNRGTDFEVPVLGGVVEIPRVHS